MREQEWDSVCECVDCHYVFVMTINYSALVEASVSEAVSDDGDKEEESLVEKHDHDSPGKEREMELYTVHNHWLVGLS